MILPPKDSKYIELSQTEMIQIGEKAVLDNFSPDSKKMVDDALLEGSDERKQFMDFIGGNYWKLKCTEGEESAKQFVNEIGSSGFYLKRRIENAKNEVKAASARATTSPTSTIEGVIERRGKVTSRSPSCTSPTPSPARMH